MKKKLFIFSNESIFEQDGNFFCENIDLKTTPEGLNKKFEVHLLGRKSKKSRPHEIKLKKIKIFSSTFVYPKYQDNLSTWSSSSTSPTAAAMVAMGRHTTPLLPIYSQCDSRDCCVGVWWACGKLRHTRNAHM